MSKIKHIVRLGLLIGIVLLGHGHAKAFLQYQLFKKDGKKVLVLGWYHEDILERENNKVLDVLIRLQKAGIPLQPVNFIYEALSPEQLRKFKIKLSTNLALQSLNEQQSTQMFSFEAYDPRMESSCTINALLMPFQRSREFLNRIDSNFLKSIKDPDSPSLATYLRDLDEAKKQIQVWRDTFSLGSKEYHAFAQKYDRYQKASEEVKKILKGRAESGMDVAIFNRMVQYLENGNILTKDYIDNLSRIFLENSDYVFADAGYLYRALTDKSNLILLVGRVHAMDLENNLLHLGYDSVSRAALLKEIPQGVKYNLEKFKGYLENLSSAYFHLVTGYKPELDSQNRRSDKKLTSACAHCGARPQNLMQCSVCKNVKYCGRDCQKKHWPAHKKDCQKI